VRELVIKIESKHAFCLRHFRRKSCIFACRSRTLSEQTPMLLCAHIL